MRNFAELGRKIIGVSSNYTSRLKEMGNAIPPIEPIFYFKPISSLVKEPKPILLPDNVIVDHEVQLGVIIGKPGANIKEENAMRHVSGYVLALDLTARDLLKDAQLKGLPWCVAKGYDTFCPVGPFIPKSRMEKINNKSIWLRVNGQLRQKGSTEEMIFGIPQLISKASATMRLEKGDLLLTGSPSGVGPIKVGDLIEAGLGYDECKITFRSAIKPKVLRSV